MGISKCIRYFVTYVLALTMIVSKKYIFKNVSWKLFGLKLDSHSHQSIWNIIKLNWLRRRECQVSKLFIVWFISRNCINFFFSRFETCCTLQASRPLVMVNNCSIPSITGGLPYDLSSRQGEEDSFTKEWNKAMKTKQIGKSLLPPPV